MWRICTLIIFLLLYICKRNGYELDEEVEKEAEVIDHEKADAFQMDAISDEHTNVYLDDHDNAVTKQEMYEPTTSRMQDTNEINVNNRKIIMDDRNSAQYDEREVTGDNVHMGDGSHAFKLSNNKKKSLQSCNIIPNYYDEGYPNKFIVETPHDFAKSTVYDSCVIVPPGYEGLTRYIEYILYFDPQSDNVNNTLYIENGVHSLLHIGSNFDAYNGYAIGSTNGIRFYMSTNSDGVGWGWKVTVTMKDYQLWENHLSSYPNAQRIEVYSHHDHWNGINSYSNSFYHDRNGLSSDEPSQYTITFDNQTVLGANDYISILDANSQILYKFSGMYDIFFTNPLPNRNHGYEGENSIPPIISFNSANGVKILMYSDDTNTTAWGFKLTIEMTANSALWMDRNNDNKLRNCPPRAYNGSVDARKCVCVENSYIHDTDINECVASLFTGFSIESLYMPYAFFRAQDYDKQANEWPEAFGRARSVDITGFNITKNTEFNKHGAKGNVTYITGGQADQLNFPKGISSSFFTYCTVSRYVGQMNRNRIFTSGNAMSSTCDNTFYHGHNDGLRGVAYYGYGLNTPSSNVDDDVPADDWLVMCGSSYSGYSNPYSIVADGKPISTYSNGLYCNLGVNTDSDSTLHSDWAVAAVVIYDGQHTRDGYYTSKSSYLSALALKLRSIFLNDACGRPNEFKSVKLVLSKGMSTNTEVNIGKNKIDNMFRSAGAVFRRDCQYCDITHRTIYYKRITEVPPGFSIYDNMVNTWSSADNVLNVDFKLYSTWNDLLHDENSWSYCDYNSSGIGFPNNCAPNVTSCCTTQYNSLLYSAQSTYDYFIFRQPANHSSEIEGCSSCPADSSSNVSTNGFIATTCTCSASNYIVTYDPIHRSHTCTPYDATANITGSAPYGVWRAEDYDAEQSILPEASGISYRDSHMISPTNVLTETVGYYGIGGNSLGISSLVGNYYTQMITPKTSTQYWTICSLTRTGYSLYGYVLTEPQSYPNWIHGHNSAGSRSYHYYYGEYNTIHMGTRGDWLVLCVQNSDDAPQNILAHGLPMGGKRKFNAQTSSLRELQLGIGWTYNYRSSEIGISELIIWDRWITVEEMESVSNTLLTRLCGDGFYWSIKYNGCTSCPSDSTSVGSMCRCPANTFWDIDSTGACQVCPSGATSGEGALVCTCSNSTYIISGSHCVPYYTQEIKNEASREPWGIYRAENWREGSQRIVEARGRTTRDAIAHSIPDGTFINSMDMFLTVESGNGVHESKTIHQLSSYGKLSGSYMARNSRIIFPKMPGEEFTYCSITRSAATSGSSVLRAAEDNCDSFHGHFSSYRGVVRYDHKYFTPYQSYGTSTDWVVICGRNLPTSTPETYQNNVILDTTPVGIGTSSSVTPKQCQMGLNYVPKYLNYVHHYWAFSELIMWDHHLSDEDMVAVNTAMYRRLTHKRDFNVTELENGEYPHSPRKPQDYICKRKFGKSTSMSFGRCFLSEEYVAPPEVL